MTHILKCQTCNNEIEIIDNVYNAISILEDSLNISILIAMDSQLYCCSNPNYMEY